MCFCLLPTCSVIGSKQVSESVCVHPHCGIYVQLCVCALCFVCPFVRGTFCESLEGVRFPRNSGWPLGGGSAGKLWEVHGVSRSCEHADCPRSDTPKIVSKFIGGISGSKRGPETGHFGPQKVEFFKWLLRASAHHAWRQAPQIFKGSKSGSFERGRCRRGRSKITLLRQIASLFCLDGLIRASRFADSRELVDSRESFQGSRAEPLLLRIALRGAKNGESQVWGDSRANRLKHMKIGPFLRIDSRESPCHLSCSVCVLCCVSLFVCICCGGWPGRWARNHELWSWSITQQQATVCAARRVCNHAKRKQPRGNCFHPPPVVLNVNKAKVYPKLGVQSSA